MLFPAPSHFATVLIAFALSASSAFGANAGITYQGRILKPDGTPLSGATTQFKLQIRTPDSNDCLMYEEIQSLDLRNSNGVFSLTINDGTGSRTDSTSLTLDRIFANRGSFTFNVATCTAGGGTYTPNSSDGRNLVVLFKDETMTTWEPIPAQKMNYIPFAFESKQVQGFTADSLLRVVNGSGDPITGLSPLSNAQYTELLALANGTSTNYTKTGQLNGSAMPSMGTGEVLGWNGTAWVSTSVASGANSVSSSMIQSGAVGTTQIANNVSINTSGTVAAAITTTRDFKVYAASPSTFYVDMQAPALTASYSLVWPLTAGSANQVLTTDGAGNLSWAAPTAASQWTTHGSNISYDGGGNVGIGTTSPGSALHIVGAPTATSGTTYLQYNISSPSPTAASTASYVAGYNYVETSGAGGNSLGTLTGVTGTAVHSDSGAVNSMIGGSFSTSNTGTATVNIMRGIFSNVTTATATGTTTAATGAENRVTNSTAGGTIATAQGTVSSIYNSGTITTAYGQHVTFSNSGTIGTSYGVYIGTGPGSTASYGLFQQSANDLNYFGGKIGVGTSSPTALLQLKAGTATAGTAPLKFTSGTLLTTAEDGAMEYNSASGLWFTIGSTRYVIPTNTAAGNYSNVSTISNVGGSITMTPAAGNSVIINQSTTSTSSTTGALVVSGGLGVADNINAGGNIFGATTGAIGANSAAYSPTSSTLNWPVSTSLDALNTANADSTVASLNLRVNNNASTNQRAYVGALSNTSGYTPSIIFGQQTGATAYAERMRIDSNGNVGIGTTSPGALFQAGTGTGLQINSTGNIISIGGDTNAALSTSGLALRSAGGTATVANASSVAASSLLVQGSSATNGSLQLRSTGGVGSGDYVDIQGGSNGATHIARFLGTGLVGIGTTSPSAPLNIEGSSGPLLAINLANVASTSLSAKGTATFDVGNSSLTAVSVYGRASQTAPIFMVGATSASPGNNLTVAANGYVGIGTTSPGFPLQVSGNAYITGVTYTNSVAAGTGNDLKLYSNFSTLGLSVQSATGNVGIATTAPAVKLDVAGSTIFRGPTVGGLDGELYYDTSTHTYRYYNSGATAWQALGTGTISYSGTLWSQNGSNVYYNSGSVGVGTTAPSATLEVDGSSTSAPSMAVKAVAGQTANSFQVLSSAGAQVAGITPGGRVVASSSSAGSPGYAFLADGATGFFSPGTSQLGVATGGTERLRFDGSGNVGIGTTAPSAMLDVATTINAGANINIKGLGAFGRSGNDLTVNNTSGASSLLFYSGSSSPVAMYIQNGTGNVGIGTTSPNAALTVAGNITSDGDLTRFIGTSANRYNIAWINGVNAGNTSLVLGSSTSNIYFTPGGTEKARLTAAGNFGIGTTAPQAALDVAGHVANSGAAASVSSCGTGASVNGNDTRGTITIGSTSVTSCVLTFASTFSSTPFCTVSFNGSTVPNVYTSQVATTTNLTVYFSAYPGAVGLTYHCLQ